MSHRLRRNYSTGHSPGENTVGNWTPLSLFRQQLRRPSISKSKRFVLKEEIGRGGFGYVRRAEHNGKEVVAKFLHVANGEAELSDATQKGLETEAALLKEKRHKNIVAFLAYSYNLNCIVTDYCVNGSLYDLMRDPSRREILEDYGNRLRWLEGIADAMGWLHEEEPRAIHRDLKPSNVFFDENWVAKVGDLGLARMVDVFDNFVTAGQTYKRAYLMLLYQPPEVIRANQLNGQRSAYSTKSDVYSFGVLIQELITLRSVYGHDAEGLGEGDLWAIVFGVMEGRLRPQIPEDRARLPGRFEPCLEQLIVLMEDCIQENPEARPDFIEIYRRIKEIRAEYSKTTPPSCTPVGVAIWGVGALMVALIVGSVVYYLVDETVKSGGKISAWQAIAVFGFLLLLVLIAIACCYQFKEPLEIRRAKQHEQRVAEMIPRKPTRQTPFALAAAMRGASTASSVDDLHRLSYSVPANAPELCTGFLRELAPNADCLYIQHVQRFCKEHQNAPEITQHDWHNLIASCLKSAVVKETQTWQGYETFCRIPAETRIDILPAIPSDPFKPGPSTPVSVPLSEPVVGCRDDAPCSSGQKSSMFLRRALEHDSGKDIDCGLSHSPSDNSLAHPRPLDDIWHFI